MGVAYGLPRSLCSLAMTAGFGDLGWNFLGNLGVLEVLRGFLLNLGIFGFLGLGLGFGLWGIWGIFVFLGLGGWNCFWGFGFWGILGTLSF